MTEEIYYKCKNLSSLKEGVWAVLRIKDGMRLTWLAEKPDNLDKVAMLVRLEPYRAEIGRQLLKLYEEDEDESYSIYDLISIMFEVIASGKKDI